MTKIFFAIFLVISLYGCATTPIPNSAAIDVPRERVIDHHFLDQTPGSTKITLKRDAGFGGSGCISRVFVNAKPIADIGVSEKVVIYLQTGDYVFSAWPNGVCGGGMSEVRSTVKTGEAQTFRVGYESNGSFAIHATAF